jgi:pimeloyl-ACP methyl ester carboxylesterase
MRTTIQSAQIRTPLLHETTAILDLINLQFSPVFLGLGVRRGAGEAVVLVPGFLADDSSLVVLHGWLLRQGYRPYFSGIGPVARCPELLVARLVQTIERACAATGRPVRLVGHSLGGVIARGAALRRPELIAQVITLGSPLRGIHASSAIVALSQVFGAACDGRCLAPMQRTLPSHIDEVNVYTREDAVVEWTTCTHPQARRVVEVRGAHCGLVVNAEAYQAIARSLLDVHAAELLPAA